MSQSDRKSPPAAASLHGEELHRQMKEYVERWKRLGPLLEDQREEDVRRSDTLSNIAAFGRLYAMAVAASPPPPTSGLVEQQRWFMKLRRG